MMPSATIASMYALQLKPMLSMSARDPAMSMMMLTGCVIGLVLDRLISVYAMCLYFCESLYRL